MARKPLFLATIVVLLAFAFDVNAQEKNEQENFNFGRGAVYVMTNQTSNSIIAFERGFFDGRLHQIGTFSTGGAGNPIPMPGDPPTDPLGSQGSLVMSDDGDFLFAVNAGSNEISVLRTQRNGSLSLTSKVPSGGTRPISIAVHDELLFVLNEGGTPNITGFRIGNNGRLTPLAGSTRFLVGGAGADPAQVGFNRNGTLLVVTEKMGNRIDTFRVDKDGLPNAPVANPSNGMTPFGFAFTYSNDLIVSEAFGGMPGQSAASSYDVANNGVLDVVSGSVANNQTAACWVVISRGFFFTTAFVSNNGSGTITSYRVGFGGNLRLIDRVAANTGANSGPIDIALSNNGAFLYVLENGSHRVSGYFVGLFGQPISIGEFGNLPAGSQGIVAD